MELTIRTIFRHQNQKVITLDGFRIFIFSNLESSASLTKGQEEDGKGNDYFDIFGAAGAALDTGMKMAGGALGGVNRMADAKIKGVMCILGRCAGGNRKPGNSGPRYPTRRPRPIRTTKRPLRPPFIRPPITVRPAWQLYKP